MRGASRNIRRAPALCVFPQTGLRAHAPNTYPASEVLTEASDDVTVGLDAHWAVRGEEESRPWIVSDELWSLIQPLLPVPAPKPVPGRPRVPGCQALYGILFVLHTGIQWEYLPQELGFGSGMT